MPSMLPAPGGVGKAGLALLSLTSLPAAVGTAFAFSPCINLCGNERLGVDLWQEADVHPWFIEVDSYTWLHPIECPFTLPCTEWGQGWKKLQDFSITEGKNMVLALLGS